MRRLSVVGKTRGNISKPGSVRIIGGMWRRRRVAVVPGSELRPTPDRVRETLFNWLAPALHGARCLDLYAGTGVLGFEALSRGAAAAVFVERDPRAATALERLRDELRAEAEIVNADAEAYLARPVIGSFDLVFVDPPYRTPATPVLASLLARLAPGARIYLERERDGEWPEVAGLRWLKRSKAGSVEFGLGEVVA